MEKNPMDRLVECVVRGERTEATDAVREHAFRKFSSAVRPFQQHVRHVAVRIVDQNGPRRGVDTRCAVTVELADGGSVFAEATGARPFAAITRAAARVSTALRRQANRHAAHRHPEARRRTDTSAAA